MDPTQQDNSIIDSSGMTSTDNNLNPSSQIPQVQPISSTQMPISTATNAQVQSSLGSPTVAEDVDLIEKEWVNKAKKIVESTKNDPSQQNIQLNKFKADYLKIRFNKDIKPMDG